MFDDIFDEMKRIMNKKFDGFDNFFTDEFLEDQLDKDQNKNTHKKPSKKKNNRSYSISYEYSTGMKEPKIIVRGEVDKETLNRFLKNINPQLSTSNITELPQNGNEKLEESKLIENKEGKEIIVPFTDVINENNYTTITLEMPGIGVDQIKTHYNDSEIQIEAEYDAKKYQKSVKLNFKPKENPKITANNGIITIEIEKV